MESFLRDFANSFLLPPCPIHDVYADFITILILLRKRLYTYIKTYESPVFSITLNYLSCKGADYRYPDGEDDEKRTRRIYAELIFDIQNILYRKRKAGGKTISTILQLNGYNEARNPKRTGSNLNQSLTTTQSIVTSDNGGVSQSTTIEDFDDTTCCGSSEQNLCCKIFEDSNSDPVQINIMCDTMPISGTGSRVLSQCNPMTTAVDANNSKNSTPKLPFCSSYSALETVKTSEEQDYLFTDTKILEEHLSDIRNYDIIKAVLQFGLDCLGKFNLLMVFFQKTFDVCCLSHSNPMKIFNTTLDNIVTKETRVIFSGGQYYRVLPITKKTPSVDETSDYDKIIFIMNYINNKIRQEDVFKTVKTPNQNMDSKKDREKDDQIKQINSAMCAAEKGQGCAEDIELDKCDEFKSTAVSSYYKLDERALQSDNSDDEKSENYKSFFTTVRYLAAYRSQRQPQIGKNDDTSGVNALGSTPNYMPVIGASPNDCNSVLVQSEQSMNAAATKQNSSSSPAQNGRENTLSYYADMLKEVQDSLKKQRAGEQDKDAITKDVINRLMGEEQIKMSDFNIDFDIYNANVKPENIVEKTILSLPLDLGFDKGIHKIMAKRHNHKLQTKEHKIGTSNGVESSINGTADLSSSSALQQQSELREKYRLIFDEFVTNYMFLFDHCPIYTKIEDLDAFSHSNDLQTYFFVDFFDLWKVFACVRHIMKVRKSAAANDTNNAKGSALSSEPSTINIIMQNGTEKKASTMVYVWPVLSVVNKVKLLEKKNWEDMEQLRDGLIAVEEEQCRMKLYRRMYAEIMEIKREHDRRRRQRMKEEKPEVIEECEVPEDVETEEEATRRLIVRLFGEGRTLESLTEEERKILALNRYKETVRRKRDQMEALSQKEKLKQINPFSPNPYNSPINKQRYALKEGQYDSWEYVPYIDEMHVSGFSLY